jgi:hypothetical protein
MKSKLTEPSFSASITMHSLQIDYQNLQEVEIKYFMIDPEVWFSSEPFDQSEQNNISFTKSVFEMTVQVDPNSLLFTHEIREEF